VLTENVTDTFALKREQQNREQALACDRGHALACVLMLLFCALLIKPFAEIGINDDFSYIRTAQLLAATGHIVYNRWASMPLGWQLYLGALFIKLFGFSFTAPRLAVFVVSLVNAYLLHRVATQFGLTTWNALLATLTVILSPAWLIMELNFMSDAPGLFCIVLCMYACQRALLAGDKSSALRWFWFAGLSTLQMEPSGRRHGWGSWSLCRPQHG
jgi:Dolichyl-phosphate-mannose-protein mannosyltransferase